MVQCEPLFQVCVENYFHKQFFTDTLEKTMTEIDEPIKRYILLILALAEHDEDYLDTYFGPESIREEAKRSGKVDLDILIKETEELVTEIGESDRFEAGRKEYLLAQLRALQTSMRMQLGESLSVTEKVENIYGFTPERVNESQFEKAYRLLDASLPGKGSINERTEAYEDMMRIPVEKLEALSKFVSREVRERTRERFGLPDGEQVDVQLVTNRPFTAALYFKGAGRSVMELNSAAPFFFLHFLIGLMAHELYPGHHTEYCFKEEHLIRDQGWHELRVIPTLSPQVFMAEMIATHARDMIMTDDEFVDWLHHELLPRSELKVSELGEPVQMLKAYRMLAPVGLNAVFMYWDDKAGEEEIKNYFIKYDHYTEEQADHAVRSTVHPIFHINRFTYNPSYRLLEGVLSRSSDPQQVFKRLLKEAPLPATVQSW
jgi:hypothetical protein